MKGLELPVNTLIVIVIAVIVMVAIVVLFTGVFTGGQSTIQLDMVKNSACKKLIDTHGCDDPDGTDKITNLTISLGNDGKSGTLDDTLTLLCKNYYNQDKSGCEKLCGCS